MVSLKRGDLFQLDVSEGEHVRHELWGMHSYVVVSVNPIQDNLELAIVVPLTSPTIKDKDGNDTGRRKDAGDFAKFRRRILESAKQRIPGESPNLCVGESIALTEQVRVISTDRFKNPPFARLSVSAMASIELGLAYVQGIPAPSTRMPLIPPQGNRPKTSLAVEEPKPVPGKPFDKGRS